MFRKKIEINVESFKEDQKKFVKRLILKAQQRFKSERHNFLIEVINKTPFQVQMMIKGCNQFI